MLKPLPTLGEAYALLLQEESKRQGSSGVSILGSDPTILLARPTGSGAPQRDPNMICSNCNIKGHSGANCYKLISYPPNFKFKNKSAPKTNAGYVAANTHVHNISVATNTSAANDPPVTQSQFDKLVKMMEQINMKGDHQVHFAQTESSALLAGETSKVLWIVDFCASTNMTSNLSLLTNVTLLSEPQQVCIPNDKEYL